MSRLLEIADACEKRTGLLAEEFCKVSLAEAFKLLFPAPRTRVPGNWPPDGLGPYTEEFKAWDKVSTRFHRLLDMGAFIEAALMLVPEDCLWEVGGGGDEGARCWLFDDKPPPHTIAYSASLALTAVVLRAQEVHQQWKREQADVETIPAR